MQIVFTTNDGLFNLFSTKMGRFLPLKSITVRMEASAGIKVDAELSVGAVDLSAFADLRHHKNIVSITGHQSWRDTMEISLSLIISGILHAKNQNDFITNIIKERL